MKIKYFDCNELFSVKKHNRNMTTEQKYNEALKRARIWQNHLFECGDKDYAEELNYIFPELKESEDEKIRKELIDFFQDWHKIKPSRLSVNVSDILAWLERQAEQKPTLPKWKYKKDNTPLLRDSIILNKYGRVAKLSSGAIVSDVWVFDYNELAKLPKEELEEQNKQKSTDKPKFKIGHWVISTLPGIKYPHLITDIKDGYYIFGEDGDRAHIESNDNVLKLWTIEDAKDGDVLKEDSCTFIIKRMKSDGTAIVHCCLFDDGDFELNSNLGFDDTCTYPATKEQRDLLFQKMKEAGYEWDAEKKELKIVDWSKHIKYNPNAPSIIKENPSWSEEDDKMYNSLTEFEKAVKQVMEEAIECGDTHNLKADADMLLRLVQKPAWSEEDENNIDTIISVYHPSPKIVNWLKSLKQRYTWKPSDAQMQALKEACDKHWEPDGVDPLYTLYEQLKKLKEK